jgi:Protein of unknown function (DUF1757)
MDFLRKSSGEQSGHKIPLYPAATLALHVVAKGAQVGSAAGLGITVVASVVSFCLRRKRPELFRKIMFPLTLVGMGATSGLLYKKHYYNELDEMAVDDRAFRIANNHGQTKVDQYSLGGFFTGAVAGVIVGQNLLALSCAGLALGPLFYKAESMYVEYKKSKNLDMYDPKWPK